MPTEDFHFLETYYPASEKSKKPQREQMKLSVIQDCRILLGNRKSNRFTHIFKVKETITINRTNPEGHPLSGESWKDNMENKRGQSSPDMVEKKNHLQKKRESYLNWDHTWWSRALVSRESKGEKLKSAEKVDFGKHHTKALHEGWMVKGKHRNKWEKSRVL